MSERSIEVPDPDHPPSGAAPAGPSPYRNLLVPLVVVPFLVVGVLVLVYVFFGAVTGKEAGLEENLARVVDGGPNESKQAAVSLVAQALENRAARQAGKPEPWPVGPTFPSKLEEAWNSVDADAKHAQLRLALAQLSAVYGDPAALERLGWFLALPDSEDAEGQLRLYAMMGLAWLDDPRAAELVIPFLRHSDAYLRQAAAAVLQNMPGEATRTALTGLLDDPSLELRGQAAISLSHLGDAAGAAVLRELAGRASYDAVHQAQPAKFASEKLIQTSRFKAVEGLARLALPEDRALLEQLAKDDADPLVREAAMRALAAR